MNALYQHGLTAAHLEVEREKSLAPNTGARELTDAQLSFAAQEAVRMNARYREMVLDAMYDEGDYPERYL
jgi:hypothetical protein